MSLRTYFYSISVGCILLAGASRCSAAEPITFSVCGDKELSFKQPTGTDRLEVRCLKTDPKPVFTIAGCIGPSVTRTPPVDVTIIATGVRTSIPARYNVTCKSIKVQP